jgi:shikimate dehydrogenase
MQSKLYGIDGTSRYGAILGASPSKGARSPQLWNAVFRAFEVDAAFGAYDVVESELGRVVAELKADPNFIGGAVGVPYKSAILSYLDEVEPECEQIRAVNALYRKNGRLVGSNTDGKGAVASLLHFLKDSTLQKKSLLILGAGGAGRAVAAYLAKSFGSDGLVRLCNRTPEKAKELARALNVYGGSVETIPFKRLDEVLPETQLLVNCTSVGAMEAPLQGADKSLNVLSTPLAPVPASPEDRKNMACVVKGSKKNIAKSLELLAMLPPNTVVYDIVYRPAITMLLKLSEGLGLRSLNGLGMNLEQAVIACHSALYQSPLWKPQYSVDAIRNVMAQVP